jgi:hypothetical protein
MKSSPLQLSEKTLDRGIVSLWVVFILIWFVPPMIRGDVLPHSPKWYYEMAQLWLPFWNFAAEMLRQGYFPTWTPHILCGWPFAILPLTNIYYTPFFPLIYLSYAHGIFLENIIGYSLAGIFAYFALRRLSFSPGGSLAGMLASVGGTCFSGYSTYVMEIRLFMMFTIMAWGIVGISRDKPRFRYVLALMTGAFALHDMEMAFYVLIFLVVIALFLSPGGEKMKRGFLICAVIGCFIFFSIWLLISLIAYSPHSIREGGVTFDYFLKNQQPLKVLLLAFYPAPLNIPGLPFQVYFGISVLWLVGYGLIGQGRKAIPIVLGLAFVLLYVMGWTPLMAVAYHIPFLNRTVLHYSAFVPALMIIAGLAASGADEAISRLSETRRHFFVPVILVLVMMLVLIDQKDLVRGILLGVLGVFGLIMAVKLNPGLRKSFFSLWVLVFLILDVVVLSVRDRPLQSKELFEMLPEARETLVEKQDMTRFWPVSRISLADNQVQALMGMSLDPLHPGAHSPLGYWRVTPTRISRLINLVSPGYVEFDNQGRLNRQNRGKALEEGAIDQDDLPLLSLMNVGLILSHWVKLPAIEGLSHSLNGDLFVYKNHRVLPRAFFVNKVELAGDPEHAFEMMASGDLDYSSEAVVEGDLNPPVLFPPSSDSLPELFTIVTRPGLWEFEIQGVNEKEMDTKPRHLLLVTENRFPGWRAELDGKEVPVYYADYAFMGVLIPGGDHSLKLVHKPIEFGIGLYATLSSAAFWLILIIIFLGMKIARTPSEKI